MNIYKTCFLLTALPLWGTFHYDVGTTSRLVEQLETVLSENHDLIFNRPDAQKPLWLHLDNYFDQRLNWLKLQQEISIEQRMQALINQRIIEQKIFLHALTALPKVEKPVSTLTSDDPSACVQTIVFLRNKLSQEPLLIKHLYGVMPDVTLQLWQQYAQKPHFNLTIQKLIWRVYGLVKTCYAFCENDLKQIILLRASMEQNAESGNWFVSHWTETEDAMLIQRLEKLL